MTTAIRQGKVIEGTPEELAALVQSLPIKGIKCR